MGDELGSLDFRMDPSLVADPYAWRAGLRALADVQVSAGQNVMVMVGAANGDPWLLEVPGGLRIDRPNITELLACGRGIHACPGTSLARVEARMSLERLLDRIGEVHIDESAHGPKGVRRYEWEPTLFLRRLKALHLEFMPIEGGRP
jgi:cytochrome P450